MIGQTVLSLFVVWLVGANPKWRGDCRIAASKERAPKGATAGPASLA